MSTLAKLGRSSSFAAIMISLLLAGCSREAAEQDAPTDTERRTPIAVYEVSPRDLSRQVTLSASVQPRIHIQIHSRSHGAIEGVQVEEGDEVSAGDVLARFDVQEENVELQRAQARATETRLERERLEQLIDARNISEAELQRAQAAAEVAEAEQALWQTRVDFGTVRAPNAR